MFTRLLPALVAVAAAISTASCGYYCTSTYHLIHPDRLANTNLKSTGATSAETVTIPCGPDARAVVALEDGNSEAPAVTLRIESGKPCVVRSVEADLLCSGPRAADFAVYSSDIVAGWREDRSARDSMYRARSVAALPEEVRTIAGPGGGGTLVYRLSSRRDVDAKYRTYVIRVRITLTVEGEPVDEVRNLEVRRVRAANWRMFGSC
ncbi:MAG TPA: hypothetical protein VHI13_04255 [Candidatus Kapabacteria bacterium]|nr:hypothetical protein [Candidatus Kapabacteria bacterium]